MFCFRDSDFQLLWDSHESHSRGSNNWQKRQTEPPHFTCFQPCPAVTCFYGTAGSCSTTLTMLHHRIPFVFLLTKYFVFPFPWVSAQETWHSITKDCQEQICFLLFGEGMSHLAKMHFTPHCKKSQRKTCQSIFKSGFIFHLLLFPMDEIMLLMSWVGMVLRCMSPKDAQGTNFNSWKCRAWGPCRISGQATSSIHWFAIGQREANCVTPCRMYHHYHYSCLLC